MQITTDSLCPKIIRSVSVACVLALYLTAFHISAADAQAGQTQASLRSEINLVPPPEPEIHPLIGESYSNDKNGDHVDDKLLDRAAAAISSQLAASTDTEKASAQASLQEMVEVQLVFRKQITQKQIDDFLAIGGEISYIYKAVSFGWNGRLPLGQVPAIPGLMGADLLLIEQPVDTKMHLDTATRTGRVRPIWVPGFGGASNGVTGNTNITIAICDTGVDESHTDLNGRRVYWHDFSSDAAGSPIDVIEHGSHVMGIATGTGASGGSGAGTLLYTDEGTLTGVPNGSFYPSPIELPGTSVTVTITAAWNGGGSTTLYFLYHTKGVSGGFTVQGTGVTGTSPLTLTMTFTPLTTRAYTGALLSNGAMADYYVKSQISGYPAVGDGFNKFRGVAQGCRWACAKVFTSSGSGILSWTDSAIDDLVANRVANNIKVVNLSLGANGSPGLSPSTRQKINTAVNNGLVAAISAGNDGGASPVDDPGRAAMALTVAASGDNNQLTDYTSTGFTSPGSVAGQEEDYKPDVMAPGGSASYYSSILSVDSNSSDGAAFADQQANDYYNIQGTSMASPFVAGCAALVIDAMQQAGVTWDFSSSKHSRFVKMVLCATASESNANRESGINNPTLQRATAGPSGFPVGKDQYEGYGVINPDAAVEAVRLTYVAGTTETNALGPNATDRRVWARNLSLSTGAAFNPTLVVPAGADFDFYLYSTNSSTYGNPIILASSTTAATGGTETFNYTSTTNTSAILVVKRISGSGSFSLSSGGTIAADFIGSPTNGLAPLTVNFTNQSAGATNYSWAFGDTGTSTTTNVTHIYTNAGSYSVTLTSVGAAGTNTVIKTNYIIVTNSPPVANFTGTPTNGVAPLSVTFTNLSSNATNYNWAFGDGGSSTATNPVYLYTNAGIYSVTLMAIGSGTTNVFTRTNYVVATNPPPVAAFTGAPTNGVVPLNVTFTNLSSNTTNYNWAFGDGGTSTATNPAHLYTNAGTYSVTLTATGSGITNTFTRTSYIVVTNPPPVANFTGSPTNGVMPLSVTFTNLSSNTTNYNWAFGDGGTSTATNPAHLYTNAGTYSVTLNAVGSGITNTFTRASYIVLTNPPPVANFTGSPTNGVVPLSVTFTNLSSNTTNYSWAFGDGGTSTATNPAHLYTNAGTYSVTLNAVGSGITNTFTRTSYIVVTNPPPVANFSGSPTNGVVPLSVTFTNLSSNATNYSWAFGDGGTSTATNPAHLYTNAGTYSVTLSAVGSGITNTFTRTSYIVVTNPPPLASFTGSPTNGVVPLSVTFTNLSSNATNYNWAFGDGGTSTATNPAHIYTNAGTYSVTLIAFGSGISNTFTRANYIVVTNPLPVANFTGNPTSGIAPLSVSFTNLSSHATNFHWAFGDGGTSTATNPAYIYTNAGIYSVTLNAFGPGGTDSFTRASYIVVTEPSPVSDFFGAPTNGALPLSVLFTNLSTSATNYQWTFGDGNISGATNVSNTYSNAGTYSVKLVAVGAGGTNTLTRTNYVVVTNPPPVVAFSGSPTNGAAPLTVAFTNDSLYASSYNWNFGDGNSSTAANPLNTYTNPGTYSVKLTAIGSGGTNQLTQTNYIVVTSSSQLVVIPNSRDFGILAPNSTAQAALVVSNGGISDLHGSATIGAGEFSILSGTPFVLPASDTTNLVIQFAPLSEGVFSNGVIFTSDGGNAAGSVTGRALNPPVITGTTQDGSNFSFSFATVAGFVYVVQYEDQIETATWSTLQTFSGDGSIKTVTVTLSTTAHRFFRLLVE